MPSRTQAPCAPNHHLHAKATLGVKRGVGAWCRAAWSLDAGFTTMILFKIMFGKSDEASSKSNIERPPCAF